MAELERIRAFLRVVEAGSFSAAARDVSSTSSIARQIKALEDELGVRLLNRSTRNLSLTEPGRLFHERATAIVNDLHHAKFDAMSFQDTVKGVLRVSLRISAGTPTIVPALPKFLEQYPELALDISLTDERVDLIAHNIDVAVWLGPIPDGETVARRLIPNRRVLCASPDYFARHGKPQKPTDLVDHNCLLFSNPEYGTWSFTKDGKTEQIDARGNIRTDNGLVLLSAALAGVGIVTAQEYMVRRPIADGELVAALEDYIVSPRPRDADLYVVYPNSRGVPLNVRVFVDFLIELFRNPA